MLRWMHCVLGLVLLVCAGCGDGGAEVSKKQFALLGELRDSMKKVQDPATLKSELPNLEKICQQIALTEAELSRQQLTTEQKRDLKAKFGKDLETLTADLKTQSNRIEKLPELDPKDLGQFTAALTAAKNGMTP